MGTRLPAFITNTISQKATFLCNCVRNSKHVGYNFSSTPRVTATLYQIPNQPITFSVRLLVNPVAVTCSCIGSITQTCIINTRKNHKKRKVAS